MGCSPIQGCKNGGSEELGCIRCCVSIIAGYIERAAIPNDEAPMTKVHTKYQNLTQRPSEFRWKGESSSPRFKGLGERTQHF